MGEDITLNIKGGKSLLNIIRTNLVNDLEALGYHTICYDSSVSCGLCVRLNNDQDNYLAGIATIIFIDTGMQIALCNPHPTGSTLHLEYANPACFDKLSELITIAAAEARSIQRCHTIISSAQSLFELPRRPKWAFELPRHPKWAKIRLYNEE